MCRWGTLKRDDGEELSALDSLELKEVVIMTTTGHCVVSASVSGMQETILQTCSDEALITRWEPNKAMYSKALM